MNALFTSITVAAALAFGGPVFAQAAGSHANHGASLALPAVCPAPAAPGMTMAHPADAGASRQALMDATMALQDAMMAGMTAADPDIAFACAMIPHHQSAIEMARVELTEGKAEPMRAMAEAIIAAQEREIAELTAWLEQQPR